MKEIIKAVTSFFGSKSETQPTQTQGKAIARLKGDGETILLIDDDITLLQALRPSLLDAGFNVLTSSSGAKGLEMLRYASPPVALVVVDYNMPRLNGEETISFLRSLNPQAKIIAVSGLSAKDLPEGFIQRVDKFFSKPFLTTELIQAILELLPSTSSTSGSEKS
jgi:two-component system, cell cycle sensor histidine kinase and response regulator CckA